MEACGCSFLALSKSLEGGKSDLHVWLFRSLCNEVLSTESQVGADLHPLVPRNKQHTPLNLPGLLQQSARTQNGSVSDRGMLSSHTVRR